MKKAILTRLEPASHELCEDRLVYNGLLWSTPIKDEPFTVYRTKEDLMKNPKYSAYVSLLHEEIIPIVRTSAVREITIAGPKLAFFTTASESLYKLEILDEVFNFTGPFSSFKYGES